VVLTAETIGRIERCVTEAHASLIEQLSQQSHNRLGADVRRFGAEIVASRVVAEPGVQWLQHVTGLTPHEGARVDEVLDWYAEESVDPRFELAPASEFESLAVVLSAAGFHHSDFVDLLWAPSSRVASYPDDRAEMEVDPVSPGSKQAAEFARVLLIGHEVQNVAPREHAAALAALCGLDGRTCYLASISGEPVSAAILTVLDGVGYLTNAATIPGERGRGAQQALVARRIADARAAGCDVVAGLATPFASSHRNMERAGLAVGYTKVMWTRRGR